ncbi:MAG: sugar nucleotide-binding protein [Flavobacteriaceae bacterium]|nr:sugar nucleotide-binding protein [Flavobacteriaceae bacterium]
MKTNSVLITEGLGFIRSNYIDYLRVQNPGQNIFVLDKITYADDLKALDRWKENSNINFIKGDSLTVVNGQKGTPTDAENLANFILKIIDKQPEKGIYHFSDEKIMSWFNLSLQILKEHTGLTTK